MKLLADFYRTNPKAVRALYANHSGFPTKSLSLVVRDEQSKNGIMLELVIRWILIRFPPLHFAPSLGRDRWLNNPSSEVSPRPVITITHWTILSPHALLRNTYYS